mmetsp:Transcript_31396/g.81567  ORF Transcript_31396/g.81567 Transcript_31396/m.81567 type:complete len:218 (-) Transcript_31396:719-1372(-)
MTRPSRSRLTASSPSWTTISLGCSTFASRTNTVIRFGTWQVGFFQLTRRSPRRWLRGGTTNFWGQRHCRTAKRGTEWRWRHPPWPGEPEACRRPAAESVILALFRPATVGDLVPPTSLVTTHWQFRKPQCRRCSSPRAPGAAVEGATVVARRSRADHRQQAQDDDWQTKPGLVTLVSSATCLLQELGSLMSGLTVTQSSCSSVLKRRTSETKLSTVP